MKLFIPRARLHVRKYFFSHRVVPHWNSLPQHVVNTPSVNSFKLWLDKYRHDMDVKSRWASWSVNYQVLVQVQKKSQHIRLRKCNENVWTHKFITFVLMKTSLHFVDPATKINGKYYRDVLLMRGFLPDVRSYSEYFTFQQDGAPAHRARETVDLPKQETPDFIRPTLWPPNSPDLNPVDYAVCGILRDRVY